MATRSVIAVKIGNRGRRTAYRAVYCHYDGYPSHQLPILERCWNDKQEALNLVAFGDMSCLHTNLGWDRETRPFTGPLYYSERGNKNTKPALFVSIEELFDHYRSCGCEHAYVYVDGAGWVHTDIRQHEEAEPDVDDFNCVGNPSHY